MQPKRNNYIGQYKKKDTIDGSFDQYWSKYCSDVKDDSIRSVLESVFNVLNDDIKLTRKASDKNQSIFDFYEYIDLMKVLKQSLDLYLGIDDNELEGRVDTARKRIKNQFVQQFNEAHEKLKKEYQESLGVSEEQTDDSESKEKLSERIKESIQNFFDKKKQEKEQESKDKEGESKEKKNQPGQVESSEKEKQDKEDKNKSKQQISDFEKRLSGENTYDSVKNVDKTKNADLSSLGKRIMGIIGKVVGIGKRTEKSKKKYKFKKTGSLFGQSPRKKVKFKNKNIEKLRRIIRYGELRGKKLFKNTILPSFKSIKKGIQGAFGMVFKVFGAILSPIGNVVKGTLNAIIHPIQTIKKFASSGIFGFFKTMMKSPSSAYMLGLFLGILYRNVIEPPLNRYIILPLLKLKRNFLKNGEDDQGGLMDNIKKKFKILTDFFKPVEGMNFLFSLLYRIAEQLNVETGLDVVFRSASYLQSPLFNAMINLIKSGLFDYFQGGGLIQKIIMLAAAQQGSIFGEVVGEDGDQVGKYKFLNENTENPHKIIRNISRESNMSEDELEEDFLKSSREVNYDILLLEDILKNFELTGLTPTMDDISAFFESQLFSSDILQKIFKDMLGGREFDALSREERFTILKNLKELREQNAYIKYQTYRLNEEKLPTQAKIKILSSIGIGEQAGIFPNVHQYRGAVTIKRNENDGASSYTYGGIQFEQDMLALHQNVGEVVYGEVKSEPKFEFNLYKYLSDGRLQGYTQVITTKNQEDGSDITTQVERTLPQNAVTDIIGAIQFKPLKPSPKINVIPTNPNPLTIPINLNQGSEQNQGTNVLKNGQSSVDSRFILIQKNDFLRQQNEGYEENIVLLDKLIASYQMYLDIPTMIGQDNTVIFDGTESA